MKKFFVFIYFIFSALLYSQSRKTIDSISNINVQYIQTNLGTVIPVLKKNVENASKSGNIKAEAKSCALLALAYYYSGNYDENIEYALRGIQLFEKIRDYESIAKEYGELGFRLKATNLPDAEKYMLKGMKISENRKYTKPLLSIYNNYGVVKDMMKQSDSALHYFFQGLELNKKMNLTSGIPYSLNNIGEAYMKRNKFDLAKKYFDEAMKYRINLKDDYGIADNYAYNGDLYFQMKNYPLAIENYEKSIRLSEKYKISNLLRHDYNMISQSYELNNDLPNALKYYKKNQVLKDSIINKETYDKMAELQMKFDTAAKEKQILEEKILNKKRINTIKILGLLFVSLLLISFLTYRSLKLKNKNQKQEYELKEAITKIDNQNKLQEQRLSISRDLHDNIGAQLTFIISSVNTLKDTFVLNDDKINNKLTSISSFTKDTIVELRDTIWAMNQTNIDFEEMRLRIMNFIEKAQNSYENVHFSFDIDPELKDRKFTSSEGMNIYRIIQESLNNALKYSEAKNISVVVKKSDSGEIEISVSDDGKGFDKNEITPGNGLRNMKKRALEIGKNFTVSSEKGKGTKVFFVVN